MNIASALEWMLRWVMRTAFGEPVDPDVSCISATSSSTVSIGSIGSAASSSSTVSTLTPCSSSTGTATRNGSETMTALASIMSMTLMVSSAHSTRSVRGVGWCSIVRLAPRIHRPWAVGAISTGSAGQHADRVAEADARGGQAAGDAPGPLVHLAPGVPDRLVRLAGHHALGAGHGAVEHLVGETAHDDLLGIRSWLVRAAGHGAKARNFMLHLPVRRCKEARGHNWGAFRSRIGDASAPPSLRPTRNRVGDPHACSAWPLVITADHLKLLLSNRQTFARN